MALVVLLVLGLLLAAWFFSEPARVARRRRRVRARPFPAAWRDILRRRVPLVARLPADLQLQLKRHIQVFLDEKSFVGCAGQAIDDEVRVTIAAQACLLLLNRRTDYFAALREILVYPGAFAVERTTSDPLGLQQTARQVMLGESWQRGQVVLSWEDAQAGARDPEDGRNVVIHEFAHQLDQEHGAANGAPRLGKRAQYARWSRVLGAEFARLRAQMATHAGAASPSSGDAAHGVAMAPAAPPLIDAYGASDPAEFFAVVSEVFFEKPRELAAAHPALYGEFAGYYRVDPAGW